MEELFISHNVVFHERTFPFQSHLVESNPQPNQTTWPIVIGLSPTDPSDLDQPSVPAVLLGPPAASARQQGEAHTVGI